jgi:hypothetical protein
MIKAETRSSRGRRCAADALRRTDREVFIPQSPHHLKAFVKTEGFVRCNDWDVFHEGLRDDLAVEGITVMCGQIEKPEGMFCRVRQDPQSQISDACHRVSLGERELPSRLFDGDLG